MAVRIRGAAATTAAVAVATLAVPIGSYPTRLGVIFAGLLMPLTIRPGIKHRSWSRLCILLLALLASGFILQTLSDSTGEGRILWRFGSNQAIAAASAITLALLVTATLRGRRPWWLMLPLIFIATAPNTSSLAIVAANPWKYWLAWPTSVAVLALARRRTLANILAHGTLVILDLAYDFRSAAAITFASLLLHIFRRPVVHIYRRVREGTAFDRLTYSAFSVGALVILTYGTLQVYLSLALNGELGRTIQLKQSLQADTVSGIFKVGRAESSATLSLFFDQPYGYGIGIIPKWSDIDAAARAVVDSGGTPSTARSIIATDGLHLHSIAGELWYSYGIAGLVAACLLVFLALRLAFAGLAPTASPVARRLPVLIGLWLLWDTLYSPIESNWPQLGVALGVALYMFATRDVQSGEVDSKESSRAYADAPGGALG